MHILWRRFFFFTLYCGVIQSFLAHVRYSKVKDSIFATSHGPVIVATLMHRSHFTIHLIMFFMLIHHRIQSAKLLSFKPAFQKFCTLFDTSAERKVDWVLQFDGGSRGNPGLGGAGAVIYASNEENKLTEVWNGYFFLGKEDVTNNEAEYTGLIEGLKQAGAMRINSVAIQGDSQLIIRQILGIYKVRKPHLLPLYRRAFRLLAKIPNKTLTHIPRAENARADELSNIAMNNLQTHCSYQNFAEYEAHLMKVGKAPAVLKKERKKRTPKVKTAGVDTVLNKLEEAAQSSVVVTAELEAAAGSAGRKKECEMRGYGV